MIGKTNTGGVGGGLGGTAALTVKAPIDVTTTVSKGDKTFTRTSGPTGTVKFSGLSTGTWNVKISDELGQQRDRNVEIKADYDTTIAFFEATINITYPVGSTVQVKYSTYTFNAPNTSGFWACKVPSAGDWVITSTLGIESDTKTVSITRDLQTESVTLAYNKIPEFTYTGDYEIVNDQDEVITESTDNWKIRFLTSGELQFSELRGAENGIDVFLVGGGGGGEFGPYKGTQWIPGPGGGSGYTKTQKKVPLSLNTVYSIIIGSGGQKGTVNGSKHPTAGGDTKAFENTAKGGKQGNLNGTGGNGGSGGGALFVNGGSDGDNGADYVYGDYGQYRTKGGTGQGTTTKEFAEEAGKLYAYGGPGGGGTRPGYNNNTIGNGGHGGYKQSDGEQGFSGIVIIRNAKN